jgi:hypothetical protein
MSTNLYTVVRVVQPELSKQNIIIEKINTLIGLTECVFLISSHKMFSFILYNHLKFTKVN